MFFTPLLTVCVGPSVPPVLPTPGHHCQSLTIRAGSTWTPHQHSKGTLQSEPYALF